MQTTEIPVCNMDFFGDDAKHFWLDNLLHFLERYPCLEFPSKFNFYALLFIEDGDGEVAVDSTKVRLDKCRIIIIKPGCIAKLNFNSQTQGKLICFTEDFFSLRYNNNTLFQFSFLKRNAPPSLKLNGNQCEQWNLLLKLAEKEFSFPKRESKKVLRSYLNIILFEIDRNYQPIVSQSNTKHAQSKVQEFENLVDKHFVTRKLPSEYAELLNITPNHLNKICKKETGQTAGDIIRKRVIIEAQRMLHYSNLSVFEIAESLGFENVSYFITNFKKQTGNTPERFRKT